MSNSNHDSKTDIPLLDGSVHELHIRSLQKKRPGFQLKHVLSHTLSEKNLMALTGLFLCLFLVVHLLGNLQLLLPVQVAQWQFNFYSKLLSGNIFIQCEAATMVAVQVNGNHAAIAFAGSQGNFELNVFKPVIIYNFLHSVRLLADVTGSFLSYCLSGLKVNRSKIDYFLNRSLMLVTALSPAIGYDKCTQLTHYALEHDLSLREANQTLKFVSDEEFQKIVRPEAMTTPA